MTLRRVSRTAVLLLYLSAIWAAVTGEELDGSENGGNDCVTCGGSGPSSSHTCDDVIERLWDAARDVLYLDAPAGEDAYQYNKHLLCEKWRNILLAK